MKIHEITSDMRSDLLSLRPLHITAVSLHTIQQLTSLTKK